MPEMDFRILQANFLGTEPIAINLGVYSYMIFPENENLRVRWCKQFKHGVVAEKTKRDGLENTTIPAQDLLDLVDQPPGKSIPESAARRHTMGLVSGLVLFHLHQLQQSSSDASLGKARYLTSDFLARRDLPSSKSRIMKAWRLMYPVSHFWTAWIMEQAKHSKNGQHDLVTYPGISPHIPLAEGIARRTIDSLTAIQGASLISRDSLWRAPEYICERVPHVRIPPLEAAILTNFEKEYREYRSQEY